jgi:hypothetical protein
MEPQAVAPFMVPLKTTEQNFGRIPRVYIECLLDKVTSPSRQKEMYTRVPCKRVISMNTNHMPLITAPEELVAHLTSL